MDESFQELENELVNLRPRRPSRALQARVEAALAETPVDFPPIPAATSIAPARRLTWFSWPLAAAAALMLVATAAVWRGLTVPPPSPAVAQAPAAPPVESAAVPLPADAVASAPGHYRPVGAASVLYDLKDDGNAYLSDNTPVRRLHYRYVDTYTWRNPATNASLKWSVPREEIRVLPASLH